MREELSLVGGPRQEADLVDPDDKLEPIEQIPGPEGLPAIFPASHGAFVR